MEERKDKAAEPGAEVPEEGAPPATGADGIVDATGEAVQEIGKDGKPIVAGDPIKAPLPLRLLSHLNIYLLMFILLAIIGGGTVLVAMQLSKKQGAVTTDGTKLSADALSKITNTDSKVGDAKQTLTVESNAIFTGKVLVRESLDVAGALKVGGSLSLTGLNVAGQSSFDQVLANKISTSGDVAIQGQLTVQKNLTVTGDTSFGGAISAPRITIDSLQLNRDLQLSRHIDTGGATPAISSGTAVGNGGTVSINGSDTSGTVTINVGGSPPAGVLATVTFTTPFGSTPRVLLTPVGSGAAAVRYYVNRSTTSFAIATTNAPPGGSFSFDYFALE